MARSLAVVLMIVATAAQAQEATKAHEGTDSAGRPKEKPRASVLAAQSVPEPSLGTSPPGQGALDQSTDCSSVQAIRTGAAPQVRRYLPPRRTRTGTRESGMELTSYVSAVVRCGQLYIFQVWSGSKGAWAAKHARLEASSGEVLHVNAFFFDKIQDSVGINTIVAAAPPGTNVSKLRLTLMSEDGRAVVLEVRDLP